MRWYLGQEDEEPIKTFFPRGGGINQGASNWSRFKEMNISFEKLELLETHDCVVGPFPLGLLYGLSCCQATCQ